MSEDRTMTGAELLLRCLKAERVRFLHAITDGTYMTVMEALERLGDELGIELVVPRHEAAGAHFADAITRVTGEPSVVMACAGPGAANLLSGIICAQAEGSPVVAITTCRRSDISDAYRHLGAMQSPDHLALFRPAVKWNGKIEHWTRIPDMVRHAFRVATSGAPGPTHLLIAEDLLAQQADPDTAPIWPREKSRAPLRSPAPPDLVRRAAETLSRVELVNIHVGNGAQRSGAGAELRALAEHLGAAVTCSIAARGLLPEDHELFFAPLCAASFQAHQRAGAVLAVGTRLAELAMWGKPPLWGDPEQQPTVQIEVEPSQVALNRPVDVPLVGDAKTVLGQLVEAMKEISSPRAPGPAIAELRATQDSWQKELDERILDTERAPMLTGSLVQACNEFFPDDAIATIDGGNTTMWAMNYLLAKSQRSVLYTSNMGYLGTGLPYAIGAKLAAPERPVYCITGDSAFGFNIQELETAARLSLPIVVLVAVDGAFGMEKTAQQRVFGRDVPWFHHDHAPVRYDRVAEAMGCHGEFVERASQLRPALERATASGKPAVIHAAVDPEANVDPPGMWIWTAARSGGAPAG